MQARKRTNVTLNGIVCPASYPMFCPFTRCLPPGNDYSYSALGILQSVYLSYSTDWCIYLLPIAVTVVEFYAFDIWVLVNSLSIPRPVCKVIPNLNSPYNPNGMNPISVPRDAAYTGSSIGLLEALYCMSIGHISCDLTVVVDH
jgi:hypothetical protein